jgi:hypothetical protein
MSIPQTVLSLQIYCKDKRYMNFQTEMTNPLTNSRFSRYL